MFSLLILLTYKFHNLINMSPCHTVSIIDKDVKLCRKQDTGSKDRMLTRLRYTNIKRKLSKRNWNSLMNHDFSKLTFIKLRCMFQR